MERLNLNVIGQMVFLCGIESNRFRRISRLFRLRKEMGVSLVLMQETVKVLAALCAENRIVQRRVAQLHIEVTDAGDLKGLIVQIDRIANLIRNFCLRRDRCCGFGVHF